MAEVGARSRHGDDLDAALRLRGLRATHQRRLVLDAVVDLEHGTPEQIAERVQRQAPALNLSTVYRTLELLEDLGVVSHTHLHHRAPTYHLAQHADHIHLVCRGCGHVTQVDAGAVADLAAEVRDRYGFSTDVAHLSLDGWCARCAAARARGGKQQPPPDAES